MLLSVERWYFKILVMLPEFSFAKRDYWNRFANSYYNVLKYKRVSAPVIPSTVSQNVFLHLTLKRQSVSKDQNQQMQSPSNLNLRSIKHARRGNQRPSNTKGVAH